MDNRMHRSKWNFARNIGLWSHSGVSTGGDGDVSSPDFRPGQSCTSPPTFLTRCNSRFYKPKSRLTGLCVYDRQFKNASKLAILNSKIWRKKFWGGHSLLPRHLPTPTSVGASFFALAIIRPHTFWTVNTPMGHVPYFSLVCMWRGWRGRVEALKFSNFVKFAVCRATPCTNHDEFGQEGACHSCSFAWKFPLPVRWGLCVWESQKCKIWIVWLSYRFCNNSMLLTISNRIIFGGVLSIAVISYTFNQLAFPDD